MAKTEQRFAGRMSDEYRLIQEVLPHFEQMQKLIGAEVSRLPRKKDQVPEILDLGCGDGATSFYILNQNPDVRITAIDNEPNMLKQARQNLEPFLSESRCRLVRADALDYLKNQPTGSVNAVASALTLHNFTQAYRARIHKHIYRILSPGGRFLNADKYAPSDDQVRFEYLGTALARFFDTFLPAEKYALLEDWVLHNVADQSPARVMKEDKSKRELRSLGFTVSLSHRENMEALLVAKK